MQEKNRKIFIVLLVIVMLAVIGFVIFIFLGNRQPNTSSEIQTKNSFSFSNLLVRKKQSPTGSQLDGISSGVGIDNTNQDDGSVDLPDSNIDKIGGDGLSLGGNDYLSSIPDAGPLPDSTIGGGSGGGTGSGGDVIIPGGGSGGGTGSGGKKDVCSDPNVSQKIKDMLCGIGPNTKPILGKTILFTLNDEEQAELDRLSRAFARLAPYLKTDGDVSREQANNEAYNDFSFQNNELSQETKAEIAKKLLTDKDTPDELDRPFIDGSKFKPASMFAKELFGQKRALGFNLLNFIFPNDIEIFGVKLVKNYGEGEDAVSDGFAGTVGDGVQTRLFHAILSFVNEQSNKNFKCDDNALSGCKFNLFEEVLDIK